MPKGKFTHAKTEVRRVKHAAKFANVSLGNSDELAGEVIQEVAGSVENFIRMGKLIHSLTDQDMDKVEKADAAKAEKKSKKA
jgi:hypothetical protein